MKRLLPLHLGLAAGCVAGFVVYSTHTRATATLPLDWRVKQWEAAIAMLERQRPVSALAPAKLTNEDLSGEYLRGTDYSFGVLTRVDFERTHLEDANFHGTVLRGVNFTDAHLGGALFWDATYDAATKWPEGFDPREHGARRRSDE